MGTIRAKFRCSAVTYRGDHTNPDTPREYQLSAVYDTDTPENRRFAKATPWGDMKMQVNNPHAVLEVGQDYYLDFTPCSEAHALEDDTVEDHSRDVPAAEGNSVAEAYTEVRAANDAGEAHPLTAEVVGE